MGESSAIDVIEAIAHIALILVIVQLIKLPRGESWHTNRRKKERR